MLQCTCITKICWGYSSVLTSSGSKTAGDIRVSLGLPVALKKLEGPQSVGDIWESQGLPVALKKLEGPQSAGDIWVSQGYQYP